MDAHLEEEERMVPGSLVPNDISILVLEAKQTVAEEVDNSNRGLNQAVD